MKKFDIEKEVELTLSSLDEISKAKAPSGFAESLANKMIFQKEQIIWINRAKYALVAMLAFAILNTVLLLSDQTDDRTELIDSMATEWNIKPSN